MVLETCHDEGHRHTDTYWLSIQHSQLKNVTIEDCKWRSHSNCVFNYEAKVLQIFHANDNHTSSTVDIHV